MVGGREGRKGRISGLMIAHTCDATCTANHAKIGGRGMREGRDC